MAVAISSKYLAPEDVEIEAVDGELVRLVDPDGYPEFPGASGIRQSLELAESAINKRFSDTTLEDLLGADAAGSTMGYGI